MKRVVRGGHKMPKEDKAYCSKGKWQGREAYTMSNGLVELVSLTGGGHIAEFRFTRASGSPTLNPLWVPPWKTMEPFKYRPEVHSSRYGPPITGRMISGIVGHNICLDFFGVPSEEEAAHGLSIHGEAPSAKWKKTQLRVGGGLVGLTLSVRLPVAGLRFERRISLRRGEPVTYFKETVTNERRSDHVFHWTQHVTLGPPFLSAASSYVAIPATRGKTFPHGYDGKALLASGKQFRWPLAPAEAGGQVDLRRPLSRPGLGFVASVLLDPRRDIGYVAALNTQHRLLIGYCFRREDCPWVAIWEENKARADNPWNGRTQTRGLEFGSAPIPATRREAFALGSLFNTPSFSTVAARARKTIQYVSFLAEAPDGFEQIHNITLARNEILIHGAGNKQTIRLPAAGLAASGLV